MDIILNQYLVVIFYQLFAIGLKSIGYLKISMEGSLASILTKKVSKVVRENDFMVFYFPHYQHEKGTHPGVAIVKDGFKLIKIL